MRDCLEPIVSPTGQKRRDDEVPPRPDLTDLRDSGTIEQDADKVGIIHRPEYYYRNGNVPEILQGLAEILAVKVRGGSTGIVRLRWRGAFTMFSEMQEWEIARAATWDRPGIDDV
ncbi:MAG: hypothetical protein HC888_03220 [Candidatus Competibacteraceae bacterium]|nr:hypothetical protein [Candidatus Competibacteraceae bacterium]